MSVEAFIDTNIFVYHLDGSDTRKQAIADRLIRDALATGKACISYQVVQECLNTVLRKAQVGLNTEQARLYMEAVLLPLMQGAATAVLYHRALDVQLRYRFSFYDSLIVAAALTAGCTRLLSEDLQDGQRIESLVIENPFR